MTKLSEAIYKSLSTEKSTKARESQNKYTFMVRANASSGAIANDVARLYKVDVINVNTMIMPGKAGRMPKSRAVTRTPKWKKAVVYIKSGQKIEERK